MNTNSATIVLKYFLLRDRQRCNFLCYDFFLRKTEVVFLWLRPPVAKKLRMAKIEAMPMLPATEKRAPSGTEIPADPPKFTTARKIAELKSDRDHWKNLCLSSRSQVMPTSSFSNASVHISQNYLSLSLTLASNRAWCTSLSFSSLHKPIWEDICTLYLGWSWCRCLTGLSNIFRLVHPKLF